MKLLLRRYRGRTTGTPPAKQSRPFELITLGALFLLVAVVVAAFCRHVART